MILLLSGHGKTHFCRELFKTVGRHQTYSFNDGVTRAEVIQILNNRHKIPHQIVVLTGDEATMVDAEQRLRTNGTQEPVIRMSIEAPVL